ncbi:ATP-binding protein [Bradyrhizobium jicamae]|uniref:GAF domain-containing sensor histidine kinase n=1 Tax=Bradyrhizobium jicamae TaxID=280332 RepID=UPI001BA62256|nr:ATP-binding protein [Bradyrhizobium jicamae]MBR0933726.1 GAF domain-containing protein [Bradyrhizobium jicamae]
MSPENEAPELALIAKGLRTISKETTYQGLAEALLREALSYSAADRGGILLSEGNELLARADASFPRERASFFTSSPAASEFRLPPDLDDAVLRRQETVTRRTCRQMSALMGTAEPSPQVITQLCLPLVHHEWTIGVLYLESTREEAFTPRCVRVMSMLASQAAVSLESVRLFEALRETNMWMVRGQEIGRMGSYRWNTRTLLSRASRECYRIFDIDLEVNPVPFEVFKSRIYPDDIPALDQALTRAVSTKSPFSHEYRVVHRDGTVLNVMAEGQFDHGPGGDVELEGIITDVTGRRAAERALADARHELARAVRLASLGELAGWIVHEISQPLTGITMSAEACLRWLARDSPDSSEARQSAMRVIEQGRRAHDVVDGLKSLVRGAQLNFTAVDINEAIEEVLLLSKRELERAGVTLHAEFGKSLPQVRADRVQLQQVVFNLVRNAVEAMVDVEGRSRVLTARSSMSDNHVVVAIADTGMGVDRANRERLFDALYTTKGNGLGLGLSICRRIVAVHGGRLWVEENMTHGSTFAFILPVCQAMQMLGPN